MVKYSKEKLGKEKREKKESEFFDNFEIEPDIESLKIEPKVFIEKRKREGIKRHSVATDGLTAGGFTSTKLDPITMNSTRSLTDDEIRKDYYQNIKSR